MISLGNLSELDLDSQPENSAQFAYRVQLGQLGIVKKHLLPILLTHWNNTELFDATLTSLQNLSSPLVLLMLNQEHLGQGFEKLILTHLQSYQEIFVNMNIWTVLRNKLIDMWQNESNGPELETCVEKVQTLTHYTRQFEAHLFRGRRSQHEDATHARVVSAIRDSGIEAVSDAISVALTLRRHLAALEYVVVVDSSVTRRRSTA